MGAYVHSKRYYLSCSKAGAIRHHLDGNPIEPVSDTDRINTQESLAAFGQQTNQVLSSSTAPPPLWRHTTKEI
ncbi:ProQ/FINO family protein [Ochrobactrum sp. A-1]|uniref:ProQ/FINO family protein n=1 Tax=Ochrobactrum sp. A-1 TaxID=2920940 RepID=UPI004045728E